MSFRIRCATAALVVSMMGWGSSLEALPFVTHVARSEADRGSALTELMEWLTSLFTPVESTGTTPAPIPPKEGSNLDPDGHH
jgi:hypothetical protein